MDLYSVWSGMLYRCYSENSSNFEYYGGRGVWVSDRWLRFDIFVEDVQTIPGWLDKQADWEGYSLDKDKLGGGTLCYSVDTCCWLDSEQQNFYRSFK